MPAFHEKKSGIKSPNAKIQPKLKIGNAGDKYEKEADAVAEKVAGKDQSPLTDNIASGKSVRMQRSQTSPVQMMSTHTVPVQMERRQTQAVQMKRNSLQSDSVPDAGDKLDLRESEQESKTSGPQAHDLGQALLQSGADIHRQPEGDISDEELMKEFEDPRRAQFIDQHSGKYDYDRLQATAWSHARSNFQKAFENEVASSFEHVLAEVLHDIRLIYNYSFNGQKAAIEAIEKSIRREEERNAMLKMIFQVTLSMFGAFIPVMNAKVDAAFSRIPKYVSVGSYKGISKAIKAMNSAKFKFILEGIKQKVRTTNTSEGTSKNFNDWTLELEHDNLNLEMAAANTAYLAILSASVELQNQGKHKLSPDETGELTGGMRKAIRYALFPEFAEAGLAEQQNFSQISPYVKDRFLRQVAISGSVLEDYTDRKVSKRKGPAGELSGFALDALANKGKNFNEMFTMPEEFAWEALNSRLSEWGVAIPNNRNLAPHLNPKWKATMKKDVWIIDNAVINDFDSFNKMASPMPPESGFVKIRLRSGPIKKELDLHPYKTSGWLYPTKVTQFRLITSKLKPVPGVTVYLNPKDLIYSADGKIADYSSFALKFSAPGTVYLQKKTTSNHDGYGPPPTFHTVAKKVLSSDPNIIDISYLG